MTGFDTPTLMYPTYRIQVFNMSYSWDEAYTDVDINADLHNLGWYDVPQYSPYVGITRLKISDTIREKSTCEFDIINDEYWMYTCDMIVKRCHTEYAPFTIESQPIDSKLIIQIDIDDLPTYDLNGTVDIVGELDSNQVSESVQISGEGGFVTTNIYDTITSIDVTGLSCHVSVFAYTGKLTNRREVKILCDTNGDGNYGLMFAGYMKLYKNKVTHSNQTHTFRCVDYTEPLLANEHICGYRAEYRCAYYDQSGEGGSCSEPTWSSLRFYTDSTVEHKCYLGDMHVRHPDGTDVPSDYTCGGYSASTEKLPYDGYTYDPNYAPDTDPKYQPNPPDYLRVMYALKTYINQVDDDIRSRDYDLHMKGTAILNEDLTDSDTLLDITDLVGSININDFILIDNEWMLVSSSGATSLVVTRGSLGSLATTHSTGTLIKCYSFANLTYASNTHRYLVEPDIGGTIKDTGDNLAEILTSRIQNSDYVFWVDFYKQLHMTEMYRGDVGYDSNFIFSEDTISEVRNIKIGEVINQVSAWVKTKTGLKMYMQMDTSNLAGYTKSMDLFGLHSKEVKNDQLNAIGYDDLANDTFGFKTFAEAYLKVHAYPRITQTVVVDSFVPDEHYWTNDYKPLLTYNDPVNKYICLLGTQVTCPDFSIDGHPSKTFVIEGLKYNITECGNFDTEVIMSRISQEDDYI